MNPRWLTRALRFIRSRIERANMYRAYPELRHIDQAKAAARRAHRPTKHFDKAREAFIASALGRVNDGR